jgi:hypothetical protein
MSVFKNKRALALVLAIVMAMSVFAVSAYATSPGVGVIPDQDDQLWYLTTGFTAADQWFDPYDTEYGHDTLQVVVLDYQPSPEELVFVFHPQYYHEDVVDYEDPTGAIGVFALTGFEVFNPNVGEYGDWINPVQGGSAIVSLDCLQSTGGTDPVLYLECRNLTAVFVDIDTGIPQTLTPNEGGPLEGYANLKIPDGVIPTGN